MYVVTNIKKIKAWTKLVEISNNIINEK